MIIQLVGHSGSGKSTLMKYLVENTKLLKPDWYTTRASRGPTDDEYNFLKVQDFLDISKEVDLEEVGLNYGNLYGTVYPNAGSEHYVNVSNVSGIVQAREVHGEDIIGIYIECDAQVRIHRMLERGDTIDKALERVDKDRILFKNAFHTTDYKITSSLPGNDVEELLDIIRDIELEKGVKLIG